MFGIHCIGGIVGALGTGLLVSPEFGGTGILDYVVNPGTAKVAEYVRDAQLIAQAKAVGLTLVWSGVGSAIIFKIVNILIGTRVSPEEEQTGPRSLASTASAATSTSTEPQQTPGGMKR